MSEGSRIIAFGSSGDGQTDGQTDSAEPQIAAQGVGDEEPESPPWVDPDNEFVEDSSSANPSGIIFPAFALLAVAGWSAFYIWANRGTFGAGMDPSQWTTLIAGWTLPVLLVGMIWLIVMRSSTHEAARFGNVARSLSDESSLLETRLTTINRELSLAREFLSAQSRELESLGRLATERVGSNADRLQQLIAESGTRVETIGEVSEAALDNMEKLRGQLPVIASSAKDVTNNIGNAGRTAHSRIEEMVGGFKRINEFGQACEAQVLALRELVNETLAGFSDQCEQLETIAAARFAELGERGNEFRARLDQQEVDALASIRHRAAALAAELEDARTTIVEAERESLDSLHQRVATLRDESDSLSRAMREGEAQARGSLRETMTALEEDRRALFARIDQADGEAGNLARSRLAAISAEADLIENGIAERADRLTRELAERSDAAETAQNDLAARFAETIAMLDNEIARRVEAHEAHAETMAVHAAELANRLGSAQEEMANIAQVTAQTGQTTSDSLAAIAGQLDQSSAALSGTEDRLKELTDASVRLLELIHASVKQADEVLPRAVDHSDAALANVETRAADIASSLRDAGDGSAQLAERLETSREAIGALTADIAGLHANLQESANGHVATLEELSRLLTSIDDHADAIASKSRTELASAIADMEGAARQTVALIDQEGAKGIERISDEMQTKSAEAMGRAIHNAMADVAGQLEQASAHAAGVSREATVQLRDQLAKVHELVTNLESRVSHARQRAEEQVDNDFARRAALITESLNSNAIDIAKALSSEVSDTAWEGYLRGDRGIFTRRAVTLIDSGDARAIQQLFERDGEFRDHVSRYIHDFEAILRQVLSTRDGHALGVTLLSSDMGKLYVSLAQSIERLRK